MNIILIFLGKYVIIISYEANTVRRRNSDSRAKFSLGDKEIAVRVRGNSHYRNLRGGAISRNAYRSVVRGRLLGVWGALLRCPLKKKGYKTEYENENQKSDSRMLRFARNLSFGFLR